MTTQIKTYLDTVTGQDGTIHCYVSGQILIYKDVLICKGFTRDYDGKFWYNRMSLAEVKALESELNIVADV